MKFRVRAGITKLQVFVVGAAGVFSGVYIWRPLFEEQKAKAIAESTKNNNDELANVRIIRHKLFGTPLGYVAMGIGIVSIGALINKYYWGPIVKRRRQETFEQHANFLYEKMKLNNEDMSGETS
ncbi:hypothetical protein PV327_002548 [Microctonus hyperodae]|uniref:Uncharacterized protein n=1 Tax=Microctonus hyperodae TaxID=165561 RepID=A0AA39FFY4_MICHY|nr:hypothetical protein PV327_002548 [Microctonus hyperodae]